MKRRPRKIEDRELANYDGRERIGLLIEHCGAVDAFDAHGVHFGTFKNIEAASAAINTAHRATDA
jgi:hypothetical protein